MSQIGRCTCGKILEKAVIKDRSTNMDVQLDVCPACDSDKILFSKKENHDSKIIQKNILFDNFGLEKLSK